MRRALLLLVASCTLDPNGVLSHAALRVHAFGLSSQAGGELQLTTTDSRPQTRVKKAKVDADTMEIYFEQGSLAAGDVTIEGELFDPAGQLTGCGTARAVVGGDEEVLIGFASPSSSSVDCGTCGNRCETDVASGECVSGVCTNWQCAPGLVPEADGGCHAPIIMPPDGGSGGGAMGGGAAGGGSAGGGGGGVPDAGPCVPSAEDSEATCSDGLDNNCDLRTDCADPGCAAVTRPCAVTNGTCTGAGVQSWGCATRTWGTCVSDDSAEHSKTSCRDGIDNDCDGKTDCNDPGCQNIETPCSGGICAAGLKLWLCALNLDDVCLPYLPVAENSALTCGNNLDDDCDGKTDCSDSSCRGRSCASGKICCADGGCSTSCQ